VVDLIGKMVIVETNETTYSGKLVEIGEEEVYLESEMGWVVIPVDKIASIREKEEAG
jgi:ribosome maturation factor RimP